MTTEIARQTTIPGMALDRRRPRVGQKSSHTATNAPQTRSYTPLVPQKGLPVGDSWKVGADACNVILFRKVKSRIGKADRWETFGYYSTLGNALVAMVRQGIRDTELASIQEVQDKIAKLEHDILRMAAGR